MNTNWLYCSAFLKRCRLLCLSLSLSRFVSLSCFRFVCFCVASVARFPTRHPKARPKARPRRDTPCALGRRKHRPTIAPWRRQTARCVRLEALQQAPQNEAGRAGGSLPTEVGAPWPPRRWWLTRRSPRRRCKVTGRRRKCRRGQRAWTTVRLGVCRVWGRELSGRRARALA
jgi:hypothetical protein